MLKYGWPETFGVLKTPKVWDKNKRYRNMTGETFLHDSAIVGIIILSVSMVLPAIRLFKGPSLPDRVVALDQITFGFVAIMLTDALLMRHEVLLDVVLIISFILALGTMIISVFLHKHLKRNQRGGE